MVATMLAAPLLVQLLFILHWLDAPAVQQVSGDATVLELKQLLQEEEGTEWVHNSCMAMRPQNARLQCLCSAAGADVMPQASGTQHVSCLGCGLLLPDLNLCCKSHCQHHPLDCILHIACMASGIPVEQQVLCFAGQHLKDHLTLADHNLEEYTLSDEVGALPHNR
jgi:hypothetical protein